MERIRTLNQFARWLRVLGKEMTHIPNLQVALDHSDLQGLLKQPLLWVTK